MLAITFKSLFDVTNYIGKPHLSKNIGRVLSKRVGQLILKAIPGITTLIKSLKRGRRRTFIKI